MSLVLPVPRHHNHCSNSTSADKNAATWLILKESQNKKVEHIDTGWRLTKTWNNNDNMTGCRSPSNVAFAADLPGMQITLTLCGNKIVSASCSRKHPDSGWHFRVSTPDIVHVLASHPVTTIDISPGATHTRVSYISRIHKKLIKIIVWQEQLEVLDGYVLISSLKLLVWFSNTKN